MEKKHSLQKSYVEVAASTTSSKNDYMSKDFSPPKESGPPREHIKESVKEPLKEPIKITANFPEYKSNSIPPGFEYKNRFIYNNYDVQFREENELEQKKKPIEIEKIEVIKEIKEIKEKEEKEEIKEEQTDEVVEILDPVDEGIVVLGDGFFRCKSDNIIRSNIFKKKRYFDNGMERYSAGILPFYVKNKTVYFLLGKDTDGKWSDFGGHSEVGDGGNWNATACREFYEESCGAVASFSTMLTKLELKKNFIRIKDTTYGGYSYYMFLIKIPYKDSYRDTFLSTIAFLKYLKNTSVNKTTEYRAYLEKTDIQWISMDVIQAAIQPSQTAENEIMVDYPLRSIFKRTLERHITKIDAFCSTFKEKVNKYIVEED